MIHRRNLLFLLLAAFCGCSGSGTGTKDAASDAVAERQAAVNPPPKPAAPPPAPAAADDMVTVVCQTRYYVVGVAEDEDLELLRKPDPKRAWDVTGIVLEVVRPPEYAGQIITMHHDGYLASGDPFRLWQAGKRYEFRVSKSCIGHFDFALCSLGGTRKVVAK